MPSLQRIVITASGGVSHCSLGSWTQLHTDAPSESVIAQSALSKHLIPKYLPARSSSVAVNQTASSDSSAPAHARCPDVAHRPVNPSKP